MIKPLLVEAKGILVDYLQKVEWDQDAIEYLIDSIDYLLSGQIPTDYEIIHILLQDIMVTSTYHKKSRLLEVAAIFNQILENVTCRV